jgi:hypothetical protein
MLEPHLSGRDRELNRISERRLKSHKPFDWRLGVANSQNRWGCKAGPCAISSALRSRSASIRRASVRAKSDPPVTSLVTSCMMQMNSFMVGLLVRAVDAGIGGRRRKPAVSTAFGWIVAAAK